MGRFSGMRMCCIARAMGLIVLGLVAYPARAYPDDSAQAAAAIQAEPVVQVGHSMLILSAALSPDGRYALTSSADGAFLWNRTTGEKIRTFPKHVSSSSGFSADSRRILTGSGNGTATLWDVETGEIVWTSPGHSWAVTSAALSPDGRLGLTGSTDGTTALWDTSTGRIKVKIHLPRNGRDIITRDVFSTRIRLSGTITSLAFSPNGKQFLIGVRGNAVILWDIAAEKEVQAFKKPRKKGESGYSIESVAFSPDGRHMLTGGTDGMSSARAILWDVASGKPIKTFGSEPEWAVSRIQSVAFSPDGRRIMAGGLFLDDRDSFSFAILWDVATGNMVQTFEGHSDSVTAVALSRDGHQALTASHDKTAILWDISTGKRIRTLSRRPPEVRSLTYGPNGRLILTRLYTGFESPGRAILWDAATGKVVRTYKGHSDYISSAAFSPDGRRMLTGSYDRTAVLWDAVTGRKLKTFEPSFLERVMCVRFSPDGRQVATVGYAYRVLFTLWDAATGQKLQELVSIGEPDQLPISRGATESVVTWWPPDHRFLLIGGERMLALWNIKDNRVEKEFLGDVGIIYSLAVTPDGRRILAASPKSAVLWDAATGKMLHRFEHKKRKFISGGISSVAISPNGRRCLIGSADDFATLWDADSGEKLRTFEEHSNEVTCVAFSPDGRRILTGSADSTIVVRDAVTGEMLCRLYLVNGGKDILAVTPKGYFDGPAEYIRFRKPGTNELYPVEITKQFHRPDLVRRALGGARR